ncbi:hypothetical protein RA25_06235 [Leisingera sp. ANG-S5]|nr:hypothetical protein RA25_06235 [Leisingera sp. ANG-S5]
MNAEVPSQQIDPEVAGKIALLGAHTTSRLPCIIPMALPARHRDRAGKIQLLAVQRWGSEQQSRKIQLLAVQGWGSEHGQ